MGIAIELPRGTELQILRLVFNYLMSNERKLHYLRSPEENLSLKTTHLPLPQVSGLAVRATNVLLTASDPKFNVHAAWPVINTVEDLCRLTEDQFLARNKNAGIKTVKFINEALGILGLRFGMSDEEITAYREGRFQL